MEPVFKSFSRLKTVAYVWLFVLLIASAGVHSAQTPHADPSKFPFAEKATYRIEWRLMTAGSATLQLSPGGNQAWHLQLDLKSVGLVDRMYQVSDTYKLFANEIGRASCRERV